MKNDITWSEHEIKIADLREYDKNPRRISKTAFDNLVKSLKQDGYHGRILIDTNNCIIGGHQRKKALLQAGYTPEHPIKVLKPSRELTEEEYKRLNIRDNLNHGEWDFEILANEFDIDDLIDWGFDEGILPDAIDMEDEELKENTSNSYAIKIQCRDEMEQEDLFQRFCEEGLTCEML